MDTSFISDLNWLAIGVATVAYFMLGALWYTKIGFGNQWIKASGIDPNAPGAKDGAGGVMFLTFILEFFICIGLAILAYRLALVGGMMSGIKLGLLTGGLIAVPVTLISYLYEKKVKSLGMINAGYHLVGNVVAAVIICIW